MNQQNQSTQSGKKSKDLLHEKMKALVYDEFKDVQRIGVIVLTVDEMTNVFVNLLASFMEFYRSK